MPPTSPMYSQISEPAGTASDTRTPYPLPGAGKRSIGAYLRFYKKSKFFTSVVMSRARNFFFFFTPPHLVCFPARIRRFPNAPPREKTFTTRIGLRIRRVSNNLNVNNLNVNPWLVCTQLRTLEPLVPAVCGEAARLERGGDGARARVALVLQRRVDAGEGARVAPGTAGTAGGHGGFASGWICI
jgi:hypothetical protein